MVFSRPAAARLVFSLLVAGGVGGSLFAEDLSKTKLTGGQFGAVFPDQALRALSASGDDAWKPAANDDVSRGAGAEVYPKVGPSIVVVRGPLGHGTGFVIDPAGWIVTNNHVIEQSRVDPATGARMVDIHFGKLVDGLMTLVDKPIQAIIYKTSPEKDLALLKLKETPPDLKAIKLATTPPTPGIDCVAIGHPKSGMLWTLRAGDVSSIGSWPDDSLDTVFAKMAMSDPDKLKLNEALSKAPKRKVLISTCGINPGDSGGPLLNKDGELIAVTFAIPKGDPNEGISLDKFSYHVHLDEVKAYVADKPAKPAIYLPGPWPLAMISKLDDRDKDGKADTWLFAFQPNQPLTGFVADIDEDTPAEFNPADQTKRGLWDFEFAFQTVPVSRTFYDRDNDKQIDYILTDTDGDGKAELLHERKAEGWVISKGEARALFAASHFADEALQKRFTTLFVSPAPQPPAAPVVKEANKQ